MYIHNNIFIHDVYPSKAQFIKNEPVEIVIEINNIGSEAQNVQIQLRVMDLHDVILSKSKTIECLPEMINEISLNIGYFDFSFKGFGVVAELLTEDTIISKRMTAFDVVEKWNMATRYGFLSDFDVADEEDSEDVKKLSKFHLNLLQYYDWMYRHYNLLPYEDNYEDVLGKKLSRTAVQNKISFCHQHGIKAFAYGAIYGAEKEFFDSHREWGLYDNAGVPFNLIDLFYIMNISEECPWSSHIINEYGKCIEAFDFNGIHMDTYGFPKTAFSMLNGEKKLVRLEQDFPQLISNTRKILSREKEDVGLIFNAVGNWPIEQLAPAEQDAVYIEVWSPYERYRHLYEIINRAKDLSGKKPVILAAYIKPFNKKYNEVVEYAENAVLLTSSVIFASGGYHLLLGENGAVLTEAYYSDYGVMSKEFEEYMRKYYDFIVMYMNLLYEKKLVDITMTHSGGINDEYKFENAEFSTCGESGKVWTIIKSNDNYKVIHMINFTGLQNDKWNEPKENKPEVIRNITITVLVEEEIAGIYIASPDFSDIEPKELSYTCVKHSKGNAARFTVNELRIWDMIYIKTKF